MDVNTGGVSLNLKNGGKSLYKISFLVFLYIFIVDVKLILFKLEFQRHFPMIGCI